MRTAHRDQERERDLRRLGERDLERRFLVLDLKTQQSSRLNRSLKLACSTVEPAAMMTASDF